MNVHEVLTKLLMDMGMEQVPAMQTANSLQAGLMANGLMIQNPPTGDFGPMAEAATQLHEGFDQLIQKGFTREEAYGLVQTMMGTMGRQS